MTGDAAGHRVLCVGGAHMDVIGRIDGDVVRETLAIADVRGMVEHRPGGVACNVAMGLARAGVAATLAAVIGDDVTGVALREKLSDAGVDTSAILTPPGSQTGTCVTVEDHRGELVVAVADVSLLERHERELLAQVRHQSAQIIFAEANLSAAALAELSAHAAATGAHLFVNPVSPQKAPRLSHLFPMEHPATVVANRHEVEAILAADFSTAADAAQSLVSAGAHAALVTDGTAPAALADGCGLASLSPKPLSGCSVTGAGDALTAGYIGARLAGRSGAAALEAAMSAARRHMESSHPR